MSGGGGRPRMEIREDRARSAMGVVAVALGVALLGIGFALAPVGTSIGIVVGVLVGLAGGRRG